MKTSQDALVTHVTDAGLFQTVQAYAGQDTDARKLGARLPACFVNYVGSAVNKERHHTLDLLLCGRTRSLEGQKNAQDVLALTEQLVQYLLDNHYWSDVAWLYQLRLADEPLRPRLLKMDQSHAIYLVRCGVGQMHA